MFKEAPLLGEPGTSYSYSSPGYVLLALIAENCAGSAYKDVLHDEVFAPLGMRSTFAGGAAGRDDLALGYRDGELVASMSLDATDIGAGDVWSTVEDLATWDRALMDGTYLSEDSRRVMLSARIAMPQEFDGVEFDGYGYGWCIGSVAGHRMFFHTGGNFGYRSVNAVLPDDDAIVVALLNEENADLNSLILTLLAVALDESN
jgi:CubicO group peptidase (beta-lactamase class C family)